MKKYKIHYKNTFTNNTTVSFTFAEDITDALLKFIEQQHCAISNISKIEEVEHFDLSL